MVNTGHTTDGTISDNTGSTDNKQTGTSRIDNKGTDNKQIFDTGATPAPQQQPTLHLPSAAEPTSSEWIDLVALDLDSLAPPDILAIQTRAMKKRQQTREEKDDKATRQSGAIIKPLFDTNEDQTVVPQQPDTQTSSDRSDNEDDELVNEAEDEDLPSAPPETPPSFNRDELIRAQQQDHEMRLLFKDMETNPRTYYTMQEGILYARDTDLTSDCPLKIVVPKALRQHVLEAGHDCTGHFGKNKTRKNIQMCFYWPGIGKDTAKFCSNCPTCIKYGHHRRQKQPMQIIPRFPMLQGTPSHSALAYLGVKSGRSFCSEHRRDT
jgi:hypothetical protein